MMWGSGLEDGNKHKRENLPFVIAGKGGGSHQNGTFSPGYEGKSGRSADYAARLCRHSDRPARWDRDEATRGNQGLAPPRVTEPHPAGADGFENSLWISPRKRAMAAQTDEKIRPNLGQVPDDNLSTTTDAYPQ